MERTREILEYWFGDPPRPRPAFWFGKDAANDRDIRSRFGADLQRANEGLCDDWAATPRGRLALILLFDQFPRNIYRDHAQAYAYDDRARALTCEGLERGCDRSLTPLERAFFYLPLEHAEDLELQERSVALFRRLHEDAPAGQRELFAGFLDYAERHRDIIARFGRFPHRNRALGRESSAEEREFLRQPGSSF